MNFNELQKANELIKTTDIGKGKEYAEVNQRVKAFRSVFPEGTISTELLSLADGVAIFKATVINDVGSVLATGHAYEKEGSSFINKTSYIENCETSAIGRALAMCGFGIDTSIASYEEVANAKLNQDKPTLMTPAQKVELLKEMNRTKVSTEQVCELAKVGSIDDLTVDAFNKIMKKFAKTPTAEG